MNTENAAPDNLNRRQFGKLLVVGAGALAMGFGGGMAWERAGYSANRPKMYPSYKPIAGEVNVSVVVIGAGLSGLVAALKLQKEGKRVLILEARDRIGGRMYQESTIEGGVLDMGGQWIGDSQTAIVGLLDDLQIERFVSYNSGRSIHSWHGEKTGFNGSVSQLLAGQCESPDDLPPEYIQACAAAGQRLPDCLPVAAQARIWNKFMDISKAIPAERPWDATDAHLLDSMTFQSWLENEGNSTYAQWLLAMLARIGGSGAFEPKAVSMLHMAWTQQVGPQAESPEKWLLKGGAGQVPQLLAQRLPNSILVSARVQRITQHARGVTVGAPGLKVNARHVIVAIPPSLRAGIEFLPPLPPSHTGFIQRTPMGSLSKVHAIYPNAFWRKQCLSGSGAGNLKTCEFIADSSPESGTPGILTSFIAGDRNIELAGKSDIEIRDLVLSDYAYYFGSEAWNISDFVRINWDEQNLTGGAFTSYLPPGVWTTYGSGWRDTVDNIFWAGTETAHRWPGYFDGAVSAGLRAANAILTKD